MDPLLAMTLAAAQRDLAGLERIAMNLANQHTPAYKRVVGTAFAARVDGVVASLDVRPGTLRPTGQPLDLALAGAGWFEVRTDAGRAYTRQGTFHMDGQGRLVTARGEPVMGAAGEIVLTQLPSIDEQGRVFESRRDREAGAQPVAQLKVVKFESAAALRAAGKGLYHAADGAAAQDPSPRVRQGFLENANVEPLQEMTQLLRGVRHLESVQKAAIAYDELMGAAIRRLGDAN